MKTEIMSKASRLVGKAGLQFKKHSPEIFMVAGIVGTVASTVIACKATTKVSKILDSKKENVEFIHDCANKGYVLNGEEQIEYSKDDEKKDLTIVYVQTGMKLVKLYAPSVALGTLSIASIVTGHNILKKRNIALAAAYAVVDKGFKDYRNRVVERFGEAIDKELRYNIKAQEVEEIVVDKNGKEKVEKKIVDVISYDGVSEYARFFDDGNTGWTKDPEYNLMYLRSHQNYFNDLLKSRGYVFLNEVYEALGIPKTKAGHAVGWIYDEENPNGDNYIDFGIYNNREGNRAFVNGYERTILLDFNVDGPIYNTVFQ